jgi:hypothetical protein
MWFFYAARKQVQLEASIREFARESRKFAKLTQNGRQSLFITNIPELPPT